MSTKSTTKSTRAKTADKPVVDFNLDAIDIPEESRPQRFAFKGKQFQTVDLSELEYTEFEKAWSAYQRTENPRPLVNMLLGADAQRFWEAKPSLFQVVGLAHELEPVLKAVFGDPGESDDSFTS